MALRASRFLCKDSSPFIWGDENLGASIDPLALDFSENIFASKEDPLFVVDSGPFDMSLDPIDVSTDMGDQVSLFYRSEENLFSN